MLIPRFLLGIISLLLGVFCLALEEGACSEIDDSCQADDYVECEDEKEECSKWAKEGECIANPGYMTFACRRSCELCADQMYVSKNSPPLYFFPLRFLAAKVSSSLSHYHA